MICLLRRLLPRGSKAEGGWGEVEGGGDGLGGAGGGGYLGNWGVWRLRFDEGLLYVLHFVLIYFTLIQFFFSLERYANQGEIVTADSQSTLSRSDFEYDLSKLLRIDVIKAYTIPGSENHCEENQKQHRYNFTLRRVGRMVKTRTEKRLGVRPTILRGA